MPNQVWGTHFKQLPILFFCVCVYTAMNYQDNYAANVNLRIWTLKPLQSVSLQKSSGTKLLFSGRFTQTKKIHTRKLFNSSLPCINFRSHQEVFHFYVSLKLSYINTAFSLKILKAYKRLIKQYRLSPFTELHWHGSIVKPEVPYSSDSLILT